MKLQNYLVEVELKNANAKDNEIFNKVLGIVFTNQYLNKINDILKKIKVKEVSKNEDIAAYQKGNTIFINKPYFSTLNGKKKSELLLHEFIHILQRKKMFGLFNRFKEVKTASIKLYNLLRREGIDVSKFLTNKTGLSKKYVNKYEVLSYLLEGKPNMKMLSTDQKNQVKQILEEAKVFNLDSFFWKERLK